MTVRPEIAQKRAVLDEVRKKDINAIFRHIRQLYKLLELETRGESFSDMLASNLRWEGLRGSMLENQRKQDAALQKIRTLWTECILVDLLGKRGRDLVATIVKNRMGNVLIDVPTVRVRPESL